VTEAGGTVAGTVRDHDLETGAGVVLLDDGTTLHYDAAAFAVGGLRLLRSGQRVLLGLDGTGAPVSVHLPG
jgi:hypothetical protein